MSGFVVEVILTFFLVLVIFMTVVHKKAPKSVYGAAIGGMVFLLHIVGVPLTGASMNPARSFAPAVATGDAGLLEIQWLYWVAPIIGGIIAGVIMNYVFINKDEAEAKSGSQSSSVSTSKSTPDLKKYEKKYLARLEKQKEADNIDE
jgi:hypothetical protein